MLNSDGTPSRGDGAAVGIMWIKIGDRLIDYNDLAITDITWRADSEFHRMTIEILVGAVEVVDYRTETPEFEITPRL